MKKSIFGGFSEADCPQTRPENTKKEKQKVKMFLKANNHGSIFFHLFIIQIKCIVITHIFLLIWSGYPMFYIKMILYVIIKATQLFNHLIIFIESWDSSFPLIKIDDLFIIFKLLIAENPMSFFKLE